MILPPERGVDNWGNGAYGSSRGRRKHRGVDLACYPGSRVTSLTHGTVTKIGYPYADPRKIGFRYVEVTRDGYRYRYFYVNPQVKKGQDVVPGTVLGTSQALGMHYPGITEHIHFEVIDPSGRYTNPNRFL